MTIAKVIPMKWPNSIKPYVTAINTSKNKNEINTSKNEPLKTVQFGSKIIERQIEMTRCSAFKMRTKI